MVRGPHRRSLGGPIGTLSDPHRRSLEVPHGHGGKPPGTSQPSYTVAHAMGTGGKPPRHHQQARLTRCNRGEVIRHYFDLRLFFRALTRSPHIPTDLLSPFGSVANDSGRKIFFRQTIPPPFTPGVPGRWGKKKQSLSSQLLHARGTRSQTFFFVEVHAPLTRGLPGRWHEWTKFAQVS